MSAIAIFILLLFGNWLLSDVLILIPINLLNLFGSFGWWASAALSLLFLAWCLGDE